MRLEEILAGLEKAVVAGKKQEAVQYVKDALAEGVKALDAIDQGLIKGMNIVGDKYGAHDLPALSAACGRYDVWRDGRALAAHPEGGG